MSVQSHSTVTIRGRNILHSTACRDYVCGVCGNRLTTVFVDGWQTVCTADRAHSPDEFVTSATWEYCKAEKVLLAEQGREIFAHLPAELQAAIERDLERIG